MSRVKLTLVFGTHLVSAHTTASELVYDFFRIYFGTANTNGNTNDRRLGTYTDICTRQCVLTSHGCFVSTAYSAELFSGTVMGDIVGKMAFCTQEGRTNPHFHTQNQTMCDGASDCVWSRQSSACEPQIGWIMNKVSTQMSFDGAHCGLLGGLLSAGGICLVHDTQERCHFEGTSPSFLLIIFLF